MANILVIHGPNLAQLGRREPAVYGRTTLAEINAGIAREAERLGVAVSFFQSNHEGEIVDRVSEAPGLFDGIIINPAAYSHYSVAIRDAIAAAALPTIEVHLSNVHAREEFRRQLVVAPVVSGVIAGLGADGYRLALLGLVSILNSCQGPKEA